MITQRRCIVWSAALVAGLSLGLAPVAGAGISDGRSPDTKDAAATAQIMNTDWRSPDTRDAALAAHSGPQVAAVDLRSPDTKDAAEAVRTSAATVVVVGSGGFDWTDAGIGAAGGFGVALILGGTLLLTRISSRRKLAL